MRFATLLITFYFLFAQTQAYAIDLNKGNVLSASAKNGGSLLVKGGKVIKGFGVMGVIQQAVRFCWQNKKTCGALIGIGAEALDDLLEDNNACPTGSYAKYYAFRDHVNGPNYVSEHYDSASDACNIRVSRLGGINPKLTEAIDYSGGFKCTYQKDNEEISYLIRHECSVLNEDELAEKIANRLTDQQLTTIINNYYNNGNGIDVDEFCQRKDVICKNQGEGEEGDDYPRWETINGRRCLVNKDKTIIRCDDEPISDNNDKHFCDTTDLTKKVCNFIDWMQETDTRSDDTNVQLQDLAKDKTINKDRVNFSASCPSDVKFTMSFAGATVTPTISYKNFCQAMIKLKPFIIGLSGISGVLIIAGGRRGI